MSTKELMLSNCGVGEDSWESLVLQGDPNQSILKEISPEYSLEGLMLKLKLQYCGHLMPRTDSLEKILTLGKIEGRRRRGRQRMRWLDGTIDSVDMLLFSRSVVSYSLSPHGLQHARLPCPSLSPGVCSNNGEVQGSLVYCNPWGHKESDTSEQLTRILMIVEWMEAP